MTDRFFAWLREKHPTVRLRKSQKAFIHFIFDERKRDVFFWPPKAGRSYMTELLVEFIGCEKGDTNADASTHTGNDDTNNNADVASSDSDTVHKAGKEKETVSTVPERATVEKPFNHNETEPRTGSEGFLEQVAEKVDSETGKDNASARENSP